MHSHVRSFWEDQITAADSEAQGRQRWAHRAWWSCVVVLLCCVRVSRMIAAIRVTSPMQLRDLPPLAVQNNSVVALLLSFPRLVMFKSRSCSAHGGLMQSVLMLLNQSVCSACRPGIGKS